MNLNLKKNILFVGAFQSKTKDGSTGGQLFACTTLINSELGIKFNIITVDTTSETVPAPPHYKRTLYAFKRLIKIIHIIIAKDIAIALIFSSAKFSFIEKGFYIILLKALKKSTVFAPRSGLSLLDYQKSKFMKWYMPKVIKNSDKVICQGSVWSTFYKSMCASDNKKFEIVHNWIDPEKYLINHLGYSVKSRSTKIVYIGWLENYKGILDLVASLVIIHKKMIDFECEIYGNGSLYSYVKEIIIKNNLEKKVFLKGWANEEIKLKAFREADIFILPSHFEGFPNVLLEAMVSELPIIATKVGAVEDLLHNEFNAILIGKQRPEILAEKIVHLINNPTLRLAIAKNARKTILNNFTTDIAVQKFEKIFDTL